MPNLLVYLIPMIVILIAGAIADWRLQGLPWHDLAFVAVMAAWTGLRAVTVPALPKATENAATPLDLWLMRLVGVGMLGLPVLALATPLLDRASFAMPVSVAAAGCVVAAAGLLVFWRSHRDLGANWSPTLEIREEHQIVQTGIYARIRHPMYLAIFCLTLAQATMLGNWIAGPAGFVAFLALYCVRVGPEERMLSKRFGPEWDNHVRRTGRLLPRLSPRPPHKPGST
jgi:protein-S-isoprenylcysteine O-methyltransferase Ste14